MFMLFSIHPEKLFRKLIEKIFTIIDIIFIIGLGAAVFICYNRGKQQNTTYFLTYISILLAGGIGM